MVLRLVQWIWKTEEQYHKNNQLRGWILYSLYWVFWGGVQKKKVKKGEIVAISL
jgi:hypothetical protein